MNKSKTAKQRAQVFSLLGKRPMSSAQLEQRAIKRGVKVDYYAICRRMSEIVRSGNAESAGTGECPIRGETVNFWKLS